MSERRIGVILCNCGSNIASVFDLKELKNAIQDLLDVKFVSDYKYACSKPERQILKDSIKKHNLT